MPIMTFPIGPIETNAYVLYSGQDAIVIDVGGDRRGGLDDMLSFLSSKELDLKAILLTHLHFDHVLGVAELHKVYPDAPIYGSTKDEGQLVPAFSGIGTWGMPAVEYFTYEPLTTGNHVYGSIACTVMATPGHTEGSMSIYVPAECAVFVGDLLFYRSVGRTDLPGGNYMALQDSLLTCIYTLPDETVAYPGHGPRTVVGEEKKRNPFVRA